MNEQIELQIHEDLFIKNPLGSKLGKRIIQESIILINELGFEQFTFKKLANKIESTETSIYRYFANKHLLLSYLVSWYWEWVSFLIMKNTKEISDVHEQLAITIHSLVFATVENPMVEYVNESILHNLVIAESAKVYHTKEVDAENEKGYFLSYNKLSHQISSVLLGVNPTFKYPDALATTILEMCNNQIYFAKHLPELTEVSTNNNQLVEVEGMLNYFLDKLLA